MKKQNRKLRLNRETLRTVGAQDLSKAVGGTALEIGIYAGQNDLLATDDPLDRSKNEISTVGCGSLAC